MAVTLTPDQLFGLKAAYDRQLVGKANAEDVKNLNYAKTIGWTPTEPGSVPAPTLSGTLNPPAAPTVEKPTLERSLGNTTSPLQAYQNLLKQGTRLAFDQGTQPTDILQQYKSVGVPLTQPGVIAGAIQADTRSRSAQIGDIYQSTMQGIQEKQKQDAAYVQTQIQGIASQAPTFLTKITRDEFDILQTGKPFTPEMQQKLSDAINEEKSAGKTSSGMTQSQILDQANKLIDNGQAGSLPEAITMIQDLIGGGTSTSTPKKLEVQIGNEIRTGGSASWRNNNPGNIKFSDANGNLTPFATSLLSAGIDIQEGSQATDGGTFITFPNMAAGMTAMKQLIFGSSYADRSLDDALNRWSNYGYGSEIMPEELRNKKISQLSQEEKDQLVQRMISKEGLKPGVSQKVGETPQGDMVTEDAVRQAVINLAPNLSVDARKVLTRNVNDNIAKGDIKTAMETVQTVALNSLTGVTATTAMGRFVAIKQLQDIGKLLNEYVARGGDTGLISGEVEKIYENVLKTTKDQELAGIANSIQAAIVDYRSAKTGAAFSPQEAATYDKMFPSIGKTPELNNALINSLVSTFELNQKSNVQYLIGPSVYDSIFKNSPKIPDVQVHFNPEQIKFSLNGRTFSDGSVLSPADIDQIVDEMTQLAAQGKSQSEVLARVNYALGY